jgi:hypothetical protein
MKSKIKLSTNPAEKVFKCRFHFIKMKESKKRGIFGLGLFVFLFAILFVVINAEFSKELAASTATDANQTELQKTSELCLNESLEIMELMIKDGFNFIRINDTIKEAKDLYDIQIILKSKKRNYDFSGVVEKCNEIKGIRKVALVERDEFNSLLKFYNISITKELNSSSIDKIISQIRFEMQSESYENMQSLIDNAYSEISAIQASQTALKIFYSATTRGLKNFLLDNWRIILTLAILALIFWIFFRLRIERYILTKRIEKLKLRKRTIKSLIMRTQMDYFQYSKIPEEEYGIKTKKFGELIRDIDRQVPLLQEELAKIESRLGQ